MLRYAITDRARFSASDSSQEDALLRQAAALAASGVDFLQLREKDLEGGRLVLLARKLLKALSGTKTRLLINSRADVAIASGADGVHLTSAAGELTAGDIRLLYSAAGLPEPVVSVSCHWLSDIRPARESGANLILFGPVFEKVIAARESNGSTIEVGVAEGIGLNLLQMACAAAAPVPVLALGGITAENAPAALAAGAAGIAAIRLFQGESSALPLDLGIDPETLRT